ncbi:threonine/serine dehydratase [Candidatus Bathyarchaeota archaeon]|jgi:threonine dehydratase|nr:threonine/serine dehydratase [Candidatus Bathyarchaeota archaeon]
MSRPEQLTIPQLGDVYAARKVVNRYLKPTPLIYSRRLSDLLGCQAYLKLENLQPTRAFKVRGGIHYMHRMKDQATKRGVIGASTGNHAQSIAYAGSLFGVTVKIVMPHGVSRLKNEAVRDLGAEVITHGGYYEEAREYAEKLASEKGYLYVHGINEPLLYEGVGTMHLEIIEEQPDIDVVINPIGGGSGACAACIVYKAVDPRIKVIGVQAEGAPALYQSWKSGTIVSTGGVKTAAEGLAAGQAYELPLRILRERLDDMVLVSDDEMKQAVRNILYATGQVAELAGAASTAAALKIKDKLNGKKVALLLTGGNIERDQLLQILRE